MSRFIYHYAEYCSALNEIDTFKSSLVLIYSDTKQSIHTQNDGLVQWQLSLMDYSKKHDLVFLEVL